ncbi:MAG: NAD(P)-dependent oxidoreductase [Propionibacteriaceae bacterium]
MTTVAVLGTGTMGAGMARSLLRAGMTVRVWNRTRARSDPLGADGAKVHATPAEAVTGADVVLIMLFDVDSVIEVLDQCADGLRPAPGGTGPVVVQCSTIGLGVDRFVARADELGLRVVDAPVLGTKAPAEAGTLTVLAAGDPELRAAMTPVFDAVGDRTIWVADRPGPASALKLVVNSWVASITASTAQAIALAEGLQLDPGLFLDALDGSAVDSRYAHVKGGTMISGETLTDDGPVSFALDGVSKDLSLITAAADQVGVSTELLDALATVYARASGAGHGDHDMAAVRAGF